MYSAWVFFLMTLLSCLSHAFAWSFGAWMNVVFNFNYVGIFLSFLYLFIWMPQTPVSTYILGIFWYFAGFGVFLGVYWPGTAASTVVNLYKLGSFFFLFGSMSLMHACWPGGHIKTLASAQGSPFWGATLFTIGSVLFVLNSLSVGPADFVQIGLIIFTAGRVCFIRGSQTARCDWLFRRPPEVASVRLEEHRHGKTAGMVAMRTKAFVFAGMEEWDEEDEPAGGEIQSSSSQLNAGVGEAALAALHDSALETADLDTALACQSKESEPSAACNTNGITTEELSWECQSTGGSTMVSM